MFVVTPDQHALLYLFVVIRIMIGASFLGVCLELSLLVYKLRETLIFKRTVLIMATFIGFCGLSRIADAALLFQMTSIKHSLLLPTFLADGLSAVAGVAAMLTLLPFVLNIYGHWHIDLSP